MHYTKDLDKVIKGLKKASKLHAAQAKELEKIKQDQKKYTGVKSPPKKTKVSSKRKK